MTELYINGAIHEPCPKTLKELINFILSNVHREDNGIIVKVDNRIIRMQKESLPEDLSQIEKIEVMNLQYAVEQMMIKLDM